MFLNFCSIAPPSPLLKLFSECCHALVGTTTPDTQSM